MGGGRVEYKRSLEKQSSPVKILVEAIEQKVEQLLGIVLLVASKARLNLLQRVLELERGDAAGLVPQLWKRGSVETTFPPS